MTYAKTGSIFSNLYCLLPKQAAKCRGDFLATIQFKLKLCFRIDCETSFMQECGQIFCCLQEEIRNPVQAEEEDQVRSELKIWK